MLLSESLDQVVDELQALQVAAAVDPRNLSLPGVWVTVGRYDARRLDATKTATIDVKLLLIVPDQGHAIDQLDELATTVASIYPIELTAAVVALPNHAPDPLPALVGTLTLNVQED